MVPASTPGGICALTANCVTTVRAAEAKAAVSSSASVAFTTVPSPALANTASSAVCLALPSDTASRTTPESDNAVAASLTEVWLPASLPSESTTMFREPSVPSASTVTTIASLSAVLPLGSRASIPAVTLARSSVGATATSALPENVTRPTITSLGSVSRYSLAASWAFTSLSSSPIDLLESSTSIVVRSTTGSSAATGLAVVGASTPPSDVRTVSGSMVWPAARPSAVRM